MVSSKLLELGIAILTYLTQNGFQFSESEPTLHNKVDEQGNMLIVCMYVDDLIFTGDFRIK